MQMFEDTTEKDGTTNQAITTWVAKNANKKLTKSVWILAQVKFTSNPVSISFIQIVQKQLALILNTSACTDP